MALILLQSVHYIYLQYLFSLKKRPQSTTLESSYIITYFLMKVTNLLLLCPSL